MSSNLVLNASGFLSTMNCQWSDYRCKIQAEGVSVGSGALAGDLGGITIWNPWSNKSDENS
jgi:hypothetical protein